MISHSDQVLTFSVTQVQILVTKVLTTSHIPFYKLVPLDTSTSYLQASMTSVPLGWFGSAVFDLVGSVQPRWVMRPGAAASDLTARCFQWRRQEPGGFFHLQTEQLQYLWDFVQMIQNFVDPTVFLPELPVRFTDSSGSPTSGLIPLSSAISTNHDGSGATWPIS